MFSRIIQRGVKKWLNPSKVPVKWELLRFIKLLNFAYFNIGKRNKATFAFHVLTNHKKVKKQEKAKEKSLIDAISFFIEKLCY